MKYILWPCELLDAKQDENIIITIENSELPSIKNEDEVWLNIAPYIKEEK